MSQPSEVGEGPGCNVPEVVVSEVDVLQVGVVFKVICKDGFYVVVVEVEGVEPPQVAEGGWHTSQVVVGQGQQLQGFLQWLEGEGRAPGTGWSDAAVVQLQLCQLSDLAQEAATDDTHVNTAANDVQLGQFRKTLLEQMIEGKARNRSKA